MEVKVEKLRGQFRNALLGAIFMLKDMGLCPDDLVENNIFREEPFSRGNVAREFFRVAKEGKIEEVRRFLLEVPYIIYEHDECN